MQQTGSPSKRAALQSDIVIVDGWGFVSGLLPIDLHDSLVQGIVLLQIQPKHEAMMIGEPAVGGT